MLLNAAKCQGYNFYRFWVSKGKTTSGLDYPPPYTHAHTHTQVTAGKQPVAASFIYVFRVYQMGTLARLAQSTGVEIAIGYWLMQ